MFGFRLFSFFSRGHGTYHRGEDLIASLAGTVHQVNRLVSVKAIKNRYCLLYCCLFELVDNIFFNCRYSGEVGDVVIGRVVDVQQKRWKVCLFFLF